MNSFFVLACLASLAFANAWSDDYCKLHCPEETNIGCNNMRKLGDTCSKGTKIYFYHGISPYRDQILNYHNNLRNNVAGGTDGVSPPAAKMLTMKWDAESDEMAGLSARKCLHAGDGCRKTDKFYKPGQNICILKYEEEDAITPEDAIQRCLENWNDSYNKTQDINEILATSPEPSIFLKQPLAQYARMITDRNCAIGCAMSEFVKQGDNEPKNYKYFAFVCNYAFEYGKPVYDQGSKAGINCTATNKKYPNLCNMRDTDALITYLIDKSRS